jgi:hypothetical protein
MPIYESICKKCGKKQDYFQPVSNYLDTPICCGIKTDKLISTPMLQASTFRVFEPFESPATGKPITNHKERKVDMEISNCREWEGLNDEKKEAARRLAYEDQKLDQKIDSWVDESVRQLPEQTKQLITGV